jgi:transposase-like protein
MNLIEVSEKFPNEKAAIRHFEIARWGEVPECAYCESINITDFDSQLRRKCYKCNKTFSVTVGTYLHHTRVPLKVWLFAFSVITDAKKGISALQLSRNIKVDYKTAFNMYAKIRELMAMETNQPDQLDGIVEIDETYVGGKPRRGNIPSNKKFKYDLPELDEKIKELKEKGVNFKRKKGNPAKVQPYKSTGGYNPKHIPVIGIVQRDGDVVAEVMKGINQEKLKRMVEEYVEEDKATLVSDQSALYNRMDKIIDHISINHQKLYSYKGVNTNSIESFWAIIKRGIMGQYHHVSPKRLPEYVAEFVFKYNNRKEDRMFETLVINSMKQK